MATLGWSGLNGQLIPKSRSRRSIDCRWTASRIAFSRSINSGYADRSRQAPSHRRDCETARPFGLPSIINQTSPRADGPGKGSVAIVWSLSLIGRYLSRRGGVTSSIVRWEAQFSFGASGRRMSDRSCPGVSIRKWAQAARELEELAGTIGAAELAAGLKGSLRARTCQQAPTFVPQVTRSPRSLRRP